MKGGKHLVLKLPQNDFFIMTFALRYASNRHTVAIGIVYDYIIEHVDMMSEMQKRQMCVDISILIPKADDIAKDYLQRLKAMLDDK